MRGTYIIVFVMLATSANAQQSPADQAASLLRGCYFQAIDALRIVRMRPEKVAAVQKDQCRREKDLLKKYQAEALAREGNLSPTGIREVVNGVVSFELVYAVQYYSKHLFRP